VRRRASFSVSNTIRAIGTLGSVKGLEEYDTSGFVMVQRFRSLKAGNLADFLFYRNGRNVDWVAPGIEKAYPPDAVFSGGKWTVGNGIVPKIR